MTDIAIRPMMMPRSGSAVSRRHARRFWGTMGAAMRTSRWLDDHNKARAGVAISRTHRVAGDRMDAGSGY